jgi:hypothetical protein
LVSSDGPRCPHCGEPLPAVVDAFCPECRTRLDEVPRPRDPVTDKVRRDLWKDNAILFTLGGVFAILGAIVEFGLWLGGGDVGLALAARSTGPSAADVDAAAVRA